MAPDIPWGENWSVGTGRIFLLVNHVFDKIFGVGVTTCRLVSCACNLIMLLLLYRWARTCFDKTIARLSAFFLATASPFWYFTLHDGSYGAMVGLFAFLSFFFLSRAILDGGFWNAFGAGLSCGLAVDVHYRGALIVVATWTVLLLSEKRRHWRLWLALGSGSLVAFAWWYSLNILPMGLDYYLKNIAPVASEDGGEYSLSVLLTEFGRFYRMARHGAGILDLGVWLLLIPVALGSPRPHHERRPLVVMGLWLAAIFTIFSLLERTDREDLVLLYAPCLSILCALGLRRLGERHPSWASGLIATLMLLVVGESLGLLYVRRDLDSDAYFSKLRSSVRPGSIVLGSTSYWYAFPDQPYYGGQFYLDRVIQQLHEIKEPQDYSTNMERYGALLSFLSKRKIEYVIGCERLLPCLERYAPGGVLPSKNFDLIAVFKDPYHGQGKVIGKPPYTTKIYRVVSHEP